MAKFYKKPILLAMNDPFNEKLIMASTLTEV